MHSASEGKDAMEYLLLIAVGVVVGILIGKNLADKSEAARIVRKEWELKQYQDQRELEVKQYHTQREQEFRTLVEQAKEFHSELERGMLRGREWLAAAFAEFVDMRNLELECWLAVKPHPALKASEQVAAVRKKHR